MAGPSLLAFNSSCSIALQVQTWGWIPKYHSVSTLEACSYGWICTAVTQWLQGLAKCNQGVMLCVSTQNSEVPGARCYINTRHQNTLTCRGGWYFDTSPLYCIVTGLCTTAQDNQQLSLSCYINSVGCNVTCVASCLSQKP